MPQVVQDLWACLPLVLQTLVHACRRWYRSLKHVCHKRSRTLRHACYKWSRTLQHPCQKRQVCHKRSRTLGMLAKSDPGSLSRLGCGYRTSEHACHTCYKRPATLGICMQQMNTNSNHRELLAKPRIRAQDISACLLDLGKGRRTHWHV